MKYCIISFFVASIACLAVAREFDDVFMFLPFLKTYEAPPACPPNEMYKTCTGQCSDCKERGMCIVTECIQGCDCAPRFFRLRPDGPCEPVANCPKPECGKNEVFRACGPVCERCTTLKCRAINCDHKCFCKEGYLRNSEGMCVPADECPKRQHCFHNEEWAESGPINEFCLNGKNDAVNGTQDVPQCYCKEGFKRNVLGYCINESLCPLIKCLGFEVYHECVPKCNTTCRNYGDPNCTEDGNCYPGCFCPPGYVMNDFRACIPVGNCSLEIEQVKIVQSSMIPQEDESVDSKNSTQSSTTENSDTTEPPDDENTEEDITKYPEEPSTTTEQSTNTTEQSAKQSDAETTSSPPPSSTVSVKTPKKKNGKIRDQAARSSKHANAAASSKVAKQEMTKDIDGDLDNEDF